VFPAARAGSLFGHVRGVLAGLALLRASRCALHDVERLQLLLLRSGRNLPLLAPRGVLGGRKAGRLPFSSGLPPRGVHVGPLAEAAEPVGAPLDQRIREGSAKAASKCGGAACRSPAQFLKTKK